MWGVTSGSVGVGGGRAIGIIGEPSQDGEDMTLSKATASMRSKSMVSKLPSQEAPPLPNSEGVIRKGVACVCEGGVGAGEPIGDVTPS